MRKSKKKNKRLKTLIIIFIIILVILVINLNSLKKKKIQQESKNEEIIVIRGLDNKHPNGTFALSKQYNGDLEMNEISTKVSNFMTSSIPTLKNIAKDKNDIQLKKYYNTYYDNIKKLFGSISEEEFVSLSNIIKNLKSDELEYVTSEYLIDTIEISEKIFKVNLKINYKNEEPIEVIVKINEDYNKISLIG